MTQGERRILALGAVNTALSGQQGAAEHGGGEPPGWRVIESSSEEGAEAVLAIDREIRVGVWLHDEQALEAMSRFSALRLKHPRVQWLALLPSGLPIDDRLAGFIVREFIDYLTLPLPPQRLYAAAGHAHGMSLLIERAGRPLQLEAQDGSMVGDSACMRQLRRDIAKVAASDAPVFISGESGTGKDLAARQIHERSGRATGPFVAVDCGAIPPTLIHSELFGYEKGAFTGAAQRKAGRIELAHGGTLFLDEVGDLPIDLQGNLLRFLQESTIQRLGSTRAVKVDARVIAATHVNLDDAVRHGRFRQDLYYRLNVLRLEVPALCRREGDIELLARYFLAQFAKESGKRIHGFTVPALDALRRHAWPGNIRELINRLRRAIVMCDAQWITPRDLDLEAQAGPAGQAVQLEAAREAAERQALSKAIEMCRNNYSAAARMLGVSRVTLYRLLEKHRVQTDLLVG